MKRLTQYGCGCLACFVDHQFEMDIHTLDVLPIVFS